MKFAGNRIVVAHRPSRAKERTEKRRKRLGEIETLALEMVGRLNDAAEGRQLFRHRLHGHEAHDHLAGEVSGAKP